MREVLEANQYNKLEIKNRGVISEDQTFIADRQPAPPLRGTLVPWRR